MKTPRPFLSGHCTPGNPDEIHARCRGGHGPTDAFRPCSCPCHTQPPEVATVTVTEQIAEIPPVPFFTPGIYDVPPAAYHASHGISASGLKRLLPPHTPAHFKHAPPFSSTATDFGTIVHSLRFDEVPAWVVSPYDAFRSNEAKAWKAEQIEAGLVVAKQEDVDQARAMVKALDEHPVAGRLFTGGKPEQSLYWTDEETGVVRRCRYDYLRDVVPGKRLVIPDLKTARSASRWDFAKAAADLGYAISAAFYMDGAVALGLDSDPLFLLVVQEKTEPYLVDVFALDDYDLQLARGLIRYGLRLYAECLERDEWPGYSTALDKPLELPGYHRYQLEDFLGIETEIV